MIDSALEGFYSLRYPFDYQSLQNLYAKLYPFAKVSGAKVWAREVLSLDVVLHRGGRAVIREPEADWSVELRWKATYQGDRIKGFRVIACQLSPNEEGGQLPFADLSIGKYTAALYFKLKRQERLGDRFKALERPAAGKPISVTWYKALLEERDQLKAEGNKSITKELARRHGTTVGGMKMWLHRAKGYLEQEPKAIEKHRGARTKEMKR
jgi:hypothetical protein